MPVAALAAGVILGVTVVVGEGDSGVREGCLEWVPGIGVFKNPAAYAVVTLVGGATAPLEEDGGGTDETDAGKSGFGTGGGHTGGELANGGDTGQSPAFTGGGDGAMSTAGSPDMTLAARIGARDGDQRLLGGVVGRAPAVAGAPDFLVVGPGMAQRAADSG